MLAVAAELTFLRSKPLLTAFMEKFNVVFVLGGPGAGKGTQCENIVREFGYTHLSAGELLRKEQNNPESKVGQMIAGHIKNGTIVPVATTCGLLEKAMEQTVAQDSKKNNFLIDGFPRNQDNLDGWNLTMSKKAYLRCVLFFDCDEDVCVNRCLERGKDSGRADDNMTSLKKRIETYNSGTMPIIEFYDKQDKVRKINAGNSVDRVFSEVKEVFGAMKS